MASDTLAEVTNLLEETLNLDKTIQSVVLCSREGVVVASVSQIDTFNPGMLATISAAMAFASTSTISLIGESKPTYIQLCTSIERIILIVQPKYQLVVISSLDQPDSVVDKLIAKLESIAVRVEILMGGHGLFSGETILEKIVKVIPEIKQAMILTNEGLPVEAVGIEKSIEMGALIGSIYANGLTYSQGTDSISISGDNITILLNRIDETRLLVVLFRGSKTTVSCKQVKDLLRSID
ncbi:MAG: hypothetical protein ACTSUB_02780 [Candidatus Thorarchaeota archaeon]